MVSSSPLRGDHPAGTRACSNPSKLVQQQQQKFLNNNSLPVFLKQLSDINLNSTKEVVESPANINAIVDIFDNVANLSTPITKTSMRDILLTTGVLTTDGSKESWNILNTDKARNSSVSGPVSTKGVSSTLLLAIETLTSRITNDSFDINTPHILLNKTTFTDNFNDEFNSSVEINVLESDGGNKSITVITFASMDNVLPVRDEDSSPFNVINGRVVLVQSSGAIDNVSFTFDIFDEALGNPKCVFWNFSLFEGIGGWDDEGCELVHHLNKTVTCNCNHLTSFSILMSPYLPDDPALFLLKFITYIGLGISIASLVICLIIEAVIWRKITKNNTSYLRHVSIVNIAVSLLIANAWFIIGAFISDADEKEPPACITATFFIHFFYLALFFWMLASGLLLLYRMVNVFDGGLSKNSMLAIGFTLGYGAPLVTAIITIAVTQPKEAYIQNTGCWLNWDQSKALLAFVVPVLLIVVINLMILLVVIYKMLRRRVVADAAQVAERHALVVVIRSLAVLTPFFGLTWGLGVGTMAKPNDIGIHVSFAFFNSLQGFFILVFGTLLDKKVLAEVEDVYIAELMVESKVTLEANTVLSALNLNTAVSDSTTSNQVTVSHSELVAECLIVGDESNCNCSTGYTWSNPVCYKYNCCRETPCTKNMSQITPLCVAKVKGLVTIEAPETPVCYKSEPVLKCSFEETTGSAGWNLSTNYQRFELYTGSVVDLDSNCATPQYNSCTTVTLQEVTGIWSGRYECGFTSGSVRHTAKTLLNVTLLPDTITLRINPLTADCSKPSNSVPVRVTATISNTIEIFDVLWQYMDKQKINENFISDGDDHIYTYIANVNCQKLPHPLHNVSITFKNNKGQKKSAEVLIPVIYEDTISCEEDMNWPKTPAGDTVINHTCEAGRVGYKSRTCERIGTWQDVFYYCVNKELNKVSNDADDFLKGLGATQEMAMNIFSGLKNSSTSESDSSYYIANIIASINILDVMARASENVNLQDGVLPVSPC
ncbi:adhesion G protein-coupled receptor F5-like [Anarrhichthys ocellatus]|uniref:adhesion G protein-coupled receptor F5-like n=1 Tax=Anarrhichthys ocellatus TaxID=433405 RepID=UPI0012EEA611|nr:adhesion G protein-coupled receptor F5-like [Anarrhichthys ocellatus]